MKSIYGITLEELTKFIVDNSGKPFNATQVFDWIYVKKIKDFKLMKNISKSMIELLDKTFIFDNLEIINKEVDKLVRKYLFKLKDSECIEAVLMDHNYGNSLCISTQVGCNMGCKFCESGRRKKIRNLEVDELVEQILAVEDDIKGKISHIVIMGIGEPFDNYLNLKKFIEITNSPKGINLGSRHITVSTCGIVPKILEFADFPYQVNLAISLHAPNNLIRNELMPINKVYDINNLLESVKTYIKKTNRRVTFEYVMLSNINDTDECAIELSKILRGINCYVNLIPYNQTNAIKYERSPKEQIMKFYDILKQNKINVTIRMEFGSKVSAACGQLRSKKEEA